MTTHMVPSAHHPPRADSTSRRQRSSCSAWPCLCSSARLPGAALRAVQPHRSCLAPLHPPCQSVEEEAGTERSRPCLSTHSTAEPRRPASAASHSPNTASADAHSNQRGMGSGLTPLTAGPRPVWPLPTWPPLSCLRALCLPGTYLPGTHTPAPSTPPLLPNVSAHGASPPQQRPPRPPLKRPPTQVHRLLLEDCHPGPWRWPPCVGHLRGTCAAQGSGQASGVLSHDKRRYPSTLQPPQGDRSS